jgi:hypothetical protein
MDFSKYGHIRAMVWVAFAMLLPLAAARAQTFPAVPLNLSGTGLALVPSIAVGPGGDINVAWLDSGAILFRRSPGGGANFSGTMVVATTNLPSGSSQPQIAVNSEGVYVAWAGTNGSGQGDIFVSSLASGASSWTLPVNVSDGSGITGSSAPVPRIAVDSVGGVDGVDVVWGQTSAFFARSTDQGKSFATITQLSNSPVQRVSPRIAFGPQRDIDIVWVKADPNFPKCSGPTIEFARSINSGATFSEYSVDDTLTLTDGTKVTGCTSDVQIATDAINNTIHLLWANENVQIQDLITTYATDDDTSFPPSGSTFPETPATFFNISTTVSRTPQMAIDSSGNIDVVWSGDFRQNGGPPAIYFRRSTDGGKTFATEFPVTNPPASGAKLTGFPQIAAEPTGAIDVLWQQASAANPNNAYDILLARSTDGATFKQFILDNSPTVTGNTGQVAVDTAGNAYVVWLGNSGSRADIFLSGDSTALTNSLSGLTASITPASATISVGGSASFSVSLNSTNGFTGPVTLACAGAPAGVSCNSPSVTVPGNAMLNVSVSAKPSAAAVQRWPGASPASPLAWPLLMTGWTWAFIFAIFLAMLIARKTRERSVASTRVETPHSPDLIDLSDKKMALARPLALLLLLAAVATALVSCGGSTNSGGGGGSITFPLTIQAKSSSATTNLQTISITVP